MVSPLVSAHLRWAGMVFVRGFAPQPLFFSQANPGHNRDSLLLEKRGPFSFLKKFLFYLFPAKGRVRGSPETRGFTTCFGPPAVGRGGFFSRGFAPAPHFVSQAKIRIFASTQKKSAPSPLEKVSLLFIPSHRLG